MNLLLGSTALCAQSPSLHRVDSLPYLADTPCMYAANVATKNDNHLFYWLIPQPHEQPSQVPLVISMNGGPGSTSMNSLFTETGPLRVTQRDLDDPDSF
jgi:carboxypeptidase D